MKKPTPRRWGGPTTAETIKSRKQSFESFARILMDAADKALPGSVLDEAERDSIVSEKETVKESSARLIEIVDAIPSATSQQSLYLHMQWILIAAFKIGFLGMRGQPSQRMGEKIGYKKSKSDAGKGNRMDMKQVFAAWDRLSVKPKYRAFAVQFINDNGGFDEAGNPKRKDVPGLEAIARAVGKREREKTS